MLLDVGITQVAGQLLEHLANETDKGVKTHKVDLNRAIARLEPWNVTIQRTHTPISTDSPRQQHGLGYPVQVVGTGQDF